MGRSLKISATRYWKYGEAIYHTRPFVIYGHGPTTAGKGHFGGIALDKGYTAEDVRYTRNGATVYAIQLGWLGSGATTLLEGFATADGKALFEVTSVEMLGTGAQIDWKLDDQGLQVTSPEQAPNKMAVVYKVTTK